MEELTKVCSKCGIEKDFISFHNDINGKFGLKARCKECIKSIDANRYKVNSNKYKEYSKVKYHKDIEKSREYNKNYNKEYRTNNPQWYAKSKDRQKKRYLECENVRDNIKKYKIENKARIRYREKVEVVEMSNKYVTNLIRKQISSKIHASDITLQLLELKRNSILLKRIIKQKIKENESTTHV